MQILELFEETDAFVSPASLGSGDAMLLHESGRFDVEFPSVKTQHRYVVRSRGWVGHIPVGTHTMVVVKPKLPIASVFGMLEVAYQLKSFRIFEGETSVDTLDELFDRVASILARRILDRARKGLYQRYLTYQDDLTQVRGRISIGRSAANYIRGSVAMYCEFDDLTRDLEENQILLWTVYKTSKASVRRAGTLHVLRNAYRALAGAVQLIEKPSRACLGRSYNKLNEDYRVLHGLCRLLLDHSGPDTSDGEHSFVPFYLNMPNLFESFIAEWLKLNVGAAWDVGVQHHAKLKGNAELSFRIDLLLRDRVSGKPVAVLDTKYKTEEISETDVQQMVAYAVETGVTSAFLIYPRSGKPIKLQVGDIKVSTIGFDLATQMDEAGNAFLASLFSGLHATV